MLECDTHRNRAPLYGHNKARSRYAERQTLALAYIAEQVRTLINTALPQEKQAQYAVATRRLLEESV